MLENVSIKEIIEEVKKAGMMALEAQDKLRFSDRDYKSDNSVVTQADMEVGDYLCERISAASSAGLYPQANIISEENEQAFDPDKSYTFVIDPIDGSDVFSQGMTGWCVSVGLLDASLTPVAGVVFAPRLDLLITADVGEEARLNGETLAPSSISQSISTRSNLMVTSRIHKHLDLSGYIGKIRGIGSAALHLCFPLIYPPVVGALEGPGAHIWDIAGAHAITRAQGEDLVCMNGDPIDYSAMLDGGPVGDIVMAGSRFCVEELREMVKRLPGNIIGV